MPLSDLPSDEKPIDRLIAIMARLRDPQTGCPWDLEQTFATIAPYTVEEAYEVADAIERGDLSRPEGRTGRPPVRRWSSTARMAEEQARSPSTTWPTSISDKMIRRHPHVFGPDEHRGPAPSRRAPGRCIKAEERADQAARTPACWTTCRSACPPSPAR